MAVATTSHLAAHLLILCGYFMAMVFVPSVLRSLIFVHPVTALAGSGFFLFCGLTHLGNALGEQNAAWVSFTDHLQAAAILMFIPMLLRDLRGALSRFQLVLAELPEPVDGYRIAAALQNQPGWDDPEYARQP